jgi:hypothetical protein
MGRFVQDFQAAGVMGIANNLEGLAMAMGGGAGLAGALTIFATAYLAFKPAIDEFFSGIFKGDAAKVVSDIDAIKERLKTLSDLKVKTAVDYSDIDEATRRLAELQKAHAEYDAQHKTDDETAAGKEFASILGNAPGGEDAIKKRLYDRLLNDRQQGDPELKKALDDERENLKKAKELMDLSVASRGSPAAAAALGQQSAAARTAAEDARKRADARAFDIEKKTNADIGGMISGGKEGDRAAQAQFRAELEKNGLGDLSTLLNLFATPEAVGQKRKDERDIANQARGNKLDEAKRKREEQEFDEQAAIDHRNATEKERARDKAAKQDLKEYTDALKQDRAKDKAEAARIQKAFGKSARDQAEMAQVQNALIAAQGGPVARSAADERRLQGMGQAYALPPEELARRQQTQMAAFFQKQGATLAGAQLAAKDVSAKASDDLQRRGVALTGNVVSNTQQLLTVAQGLMAEQDKMAQQVAHQGRQIQQLSNRGRSQAAHHQPAGGFARW